jgi:hypothetical protein
MAAYLDGNDKVIDTPTIALPANHSYFVRIN